MFRDPLLGRIARELGYNTEAGSVYGIGLRNSGNAQILIAQTAPVRVQAVDLLKGVGLPQEVENMGCATVHVSAVTDKVRAPYIAGTPNQRIQLAVDWQTGRGGGSALVDASQGSMFTLNGATVVNVKATFVSNALDAEGAPVALVGGDDKRLEASVQWGTATFQPAYFPVGSIGLGMATPSVALPVPRQARKVSVFSDTPGATVAIDFGGAGGGRFYGAEFTRQNATGASAPVADGAETFTLTANVACVALAIFELWL